jgi:hypothetical protein
MQKKVKYVGEGGHLFPDWNWAPQHGEIREVEIDPEQNLGPYLDETDEPVTVEEAE